LPLFVLLIHSLETSRESIVSSQCGACLIKDSDTSKYLPPTLSTVVLVPWIELFLVVAVLVVVSIVLLFVTYLKG